MSALQDVLDGIDIVSKAINNVGEITEAIKKGKGYLENRYPDAKEDVCKILREMNETLITTSGATAIITSFSFIGEPSQYADDLREFNNRMVEGKSEIVHLRQNIDEYRGHCSVIQNHAAKIEKGNNLDSFFRIFGIKSSQENMELSERLKSIYNEEEAHYVTVYGLCDNLERAIDHVHETLGAPGLLQPQSVPEGQVLLAEYRTAFKKVESESNFRVMQIRKLIRELS